MLLGFLPFFELLLRKLHLLPRKFGLLRVLIEKDNFASECIESEGSPLVLSLVGICLNVKVLSRTLILEPP